MSILNNINEISYKGDEVIDVQFSAGVSVASMYFKSGKIITFHINDDGSFTRRDYMNKVKINNRNLTIDKLIHANKKDT